MGMDIKEITFKEKGQTLINMFTEHEIWRGEVDLEKGYQRTMRW